MKLYELQYKGEVFIWVAADGPIEACTLARNTDEPCTLKAPVIRELDKNHKACSIVIDDEDLGSLPLWDYYQKLDAPAVISCSEW